LPALALDEPLLDIRSAARLLSTTPRHVRALVERGAIPYLKVGRLIRFDRAALAEHLASSAERRR
jgi:excisionase family DNA binding protein